MTGNVVARRYARALFAIGKEEGPKALDTYGKDLAQLAESLAKAPQLLRMFRNPIFSVEEKKGVLDKLVAKLEINNVVANFCRLLAEKERLGMLPDIEAVFSTLLDAEQGVVRGELVTAVKLAAAKQKDLKAKLEKQTGRKLVLDFSVDKSIIGGVMLKVGDNIMDASLRAQLEILKENIKRGE